MPGAPAQRALMCLARRRLRQTGYVDVAEHALNRSPRLRAARESTRATVGCVPHPMMCGSCYANEFDRRAGSRRLCCGYFGMSPVSPCLSSGAAGCRPPRKCNAARRLNSCSRANVTMVPDHSLLHVHAPRVDRETHSGNALAPHRRSRESHTARSEVADRSAHS